MARTLAASTRSSTSVPRIARGAPSGVSLSTYFQVTAAPLGVEDWSSVARIYGEGIATGNATFERAVPSWEEWRGARVDDPCLVAREESGEVLGWAALSPVSARAVYRGVGEVGVYVDQRHARRGIGRVLLSALVESSERAGFWTVQAGIFPENEGSIALHESCGFRLVGRRERVGMMPDGTWRDVMLYERRSSVVGGD